MTDTEENGFSLDDLTGMPPSQEWAVEKPDPTTMIALWPEDDAPTQTEIHSALSSSLGAEVQIIEELDHNEPDVLWNMVVEIPGLPVPVIVWSEPNRQMGAGEVDDHAILSCKWVVGFETMLNMDDPLTTWGMMVRVIVGALPATPAIVDANAFRMHERALLDQHFLDAGVEPSSEMLWVIHEANDESGEEGAATAWLHTHGLARCGRPELEVVGVPEDRSNAAAELLNAIGALLLEEHLPPPGVVFNPGPDLEVVVQPWREVAATIPENAIASIRSREESDDPTHAGVRAVICDPTPRGQYRAVWTWPQAVIDRIATEGVALFRTERYSARQTALAQAAWPEFAMSFASVFGPAGDESDGETLVFLVKASIDGDDDSEAGRENLWLRVRRFQGARLDAELINKPLSMPDLNRGDRLTIDGERVSDWAVITPHGTFQADTCAGLRSAIDEVRRGSEES